ncbi:MAG: hypothetical protein PWK00_00750, partial [Coxiella burnetii]|nr:hypothetical protein [Coxiella burnetii]
NDADIGVKSWQGKYPNLKSAAESRPERREIGLIKGKTNNTWIHFYPPSRLLLDNFHKRFSPLSSRSHTDLSDYFWPLWRGDPNHLILVPFSMSLSEPQWKKCSFDLKTNSMGTLTDFSIAEKCPSEMS